MSEAEELECLHFDPWLTCSGPRLVQVAAEVLSKLPAPCVTLGRKPRGDAAMRRRRCVESIVANAVSLALSPSEYDAIAAPLRKTKQTRYDYCGYGPAMLSATIEAMREAGLLAIIKGAKGQARTRILPTDSFRSMLVDADISISDVGREAGRETILLRARSETEMGGVVLVDYADTEETIKFREEVETVNEALTLADIRYEGKPILPVHLVRIFNVENEEDPPRFDRHGRLYRGGFWLTLPERKRQLITINGEPVADLDFSSMFFRLAYVTQGVKSPEGDLYAIPGLEGCRPTVKRLVASLFSRTGPAQRLPRKFRRELPAGWTMPRFVAAMVERHPAIAPLFGKALWFSFAFTESQIMVEILLALIAKGIVALPMHDGLMVARSHRDLAVRTMREVSLRNLGEALPVSEKALISPNPK